MVCLHDLLVQNIMCSTAAALPHHFCEMYVFLNHILMYYANDLADTFNLTLPLTRTCR